MLLDALTHTYFGLRKSKDGDKTEPFTVLQSLEKISFDVMKLS